MDMKKILQALDNVADRKIVGGDDMRKYLTIVAKQPVNESVITSFEEDTVGGNANSFLIAADNITDLVMGNIDKIKINADERLLKDMMEKFNSFMSAYHVLGKEILQPDMFNDSVDRDIDESGLQYYTGVKKHGKEYMDKAAQAGREGASQKELGALKDKYSKAHKEDLDVAEAAKKGLYYNVNKRKADGTSRDASSPKAPTAQAWKDAAKTAKKEGVQNGLSFKDYFALEEAVAGPKDCWPGHRKTGTQPGTGKNAGKRVNDCEKIKKKK